MAAPIDPPPPRDIWHLSIDDLLAPLPLKTCLGGPGPFVINLSASTAPIDVPKKTFPGCETAYLYHLQRMEDRRPRYRLRLGPFADEDSADAVLQNVRDTYPGALTATADTDDLRAIASLQPKVEPTASPPRSVAAEKPAAHRASSHRPSTPPAAAASSPSKPVPSRVAPPPLLKPVVAKPAVARAAPPPVLKPAAPRAAPAPVPKATVLPPPAPPVIKPIAAPPPARPIWTTAPPYRPAPNDSPLQVRKGVPSLETTQTVRALTMLEVEDDEASQWFVIQLSLANEPFDPETLPNLDIFSVYRLYSVAGIEQGRIMHALRLGFFSAELAASAVASYLNAFYERPAIKRVSAAERGRFAEQTVEPRKDIGATGKHAVIEITDERFVRERRAHPRHK